MLPLALGAIAAIVAAAVERNESLSVREAFGRLEGRNDSLVAVQIEANLLVIIGLALLVIPGVIAMAWTAVCVPVVVIEGLGYSKAIARSGKLTCGHWKHVLGTALLSWAIVLGLMMGSGIIAGIVGAQSLAVGILSDPLFAVVIPIPAIAMTFLYYDIRGRSEAADLDAMVAELPPTPEGTLASD